MPQNNPKHQNESTDSALATNEEDSLEVNTEEFECKVCVHVLSQCRTESRYKDSNKTFENLAKLKKI
jgi:hypothetical protein